MNTLNNIQNEPKQVRDLYKGTTYTKITGYVDRTPVIAYVYPGLDSGLSHYKIDGKTKIGTVNFTTISKEEKVEY